MTPTQLQQLVIEALEDLKAIDIVTLDVRGLTSITDYMVICSGSSNRHVNALADSVIEKSKEHNIAPLGIEGKELGEWALLDLNDVIVHIMQPKVREFYALEKLWDESSIGNTETLKSKR